MRAEGALVEVMVTVHVALWAERFVASQALFAFHAAGVLVAPTYTVALDESFDITADVLGGC